MKQFRRLALSLGLATVVAVGPLGLTAPALAALTHPAVLAVQSKSQSAQSWARSEWGTFTSWKRSGTGDDLLTVPKNVKAAVLTVTHDGESNFVVETLNRKNHLDDLLVNEIGTYSGTRVFGLESKSTAKRIQITADGAWTLTMKPISKAPTLPKSHTGDGVYLIKHAAGALRLTHDGQSNFVVSQHTGGKYGYDLLVNEIGKYKGTVPTEGGPSVVEVEADGTWTASFR